MLTLPSHAGLASTVHWEPRQQIATPALLEHTLQPPTLPMLPIVPSVILGNTALVS